MFKKILIANRGEIACRIIRTLQAMGIRTIAIYSEADENALHVEMADEAYLVGPSPVGESYLNILKILQITQESGAEAIHPGYGFLSENADFAKAVLKAGLVFIGPSPQAIAVMGDKLEAKRLALKAGVTCLQGMDVPLENAKDAEKLAQSIGYPVMVKAAAGGGGKGMRVVRDPAQLKSAVKGAQNESRSSFGDDRIFLEKYIESPRHIEIQILADTQGNVIYLGERECSLQRRHQKVIEEAPSLFVTPEMRCAMGEEAVRLAKEVNYSSVGTVEFVVDQEGHFYFLEMNTRLQVEHTVTEMITGLDLVEEMIHIAAGEPLRFTQSDVQLQGHAIEARIYAEDSVRGFLPSTGRIRTYIPPPEKEGKVRLDSGVEEGSHITLFYDPMIGKLIVHQPDRQQACQSLLEALNHYYIRGIETNISFLAELADASFFEEGEFSTTTLDEKYGEGFTPKSPIDPDVVVGAAAVMHMVREGEPQAEFTVLIEREAYPVSVFCEGDRFEINSEKTLIVESTWKPGDLLFEGVFNGHAVTLQIDSLGISDRLSWSGYSVLCAVLNQQVAALFQRMPVKTNLEKDDVVKAPMPGLVVELLVKEGDAIKAGQSLMTIEAMKMENIIRAERDGMIEKLSVKQGESVNLDQELMKLK